MKLEKLKQLIVAKVISRNDFGSVDALLEAISSANSLSEWKFRKDAFNAIGNKSPLVSIGNDFYCVTLATLPVFIDEQVAMFLDAINFASTNDDEIESVCNRLLDSEEHAGDSAIPSIAEDAAELIRRLASDKDALQAKIDQLMLEYCPDEITPEQMAEYESHQRPSSLNV
jgi:hypothetical protein